MSVFWACTTAAFVLGPSWPQWRLSHAFVAVRLACPASFLAVILLQPHRSPVAKRGGRVGALVLVLILVPTLLVLLSGMPPPGMAIDSSVPTLIFGSHLALALVGVALAEQVYRHCPATLRWNLRPLCLGLAGPFVLDVVIYSDPLLFRALDPHLWAARGFAYALAIPLLGLAALFNHFR